MLPMYPSNSLNNSGLVNDLPQVNSSQDARSQLTRPSTRDVLWDKEENYFYMRITDATGKIISFERYEYNPSPEPKPEDLFVSKDTFNTVTNELQGGINDVKESIQQLIALQQQQSNESNAKSKPKFSPNNTNNH